MNKRQIKRFSFEKLDHIWQNIIVTHNLVNIQQVSGNDLNIIDTDKYTYIMTYSFPCQDLSLAGKGKGMSDTSTRSGMLWEVERILTECKEFGNMPEVLLMENVTQVHGKGNLDDFHKWQSKLEEFGYKNYTQDLIATDYGIPQTRNRCFMVSILGDYSYTFPKAIPLELRLKDLLEEEVDEKYYLSDKLIENLKFNKNKNCNPSGKGMNGRIYDCEIAPTLTTNKGEGIKVNVSRLYGIFDNKNLTYQAGSVYDLNGLCPTLDTMQGGYRQPCIEIKNSTKKGYLEATIGDAIDLSQPKSETRRGRVQKEKSQTLTTSCNVGTIVKDNLKTKLCNDLIISGKVKENDVIRHSYSTSRMNGEQKDLKQNNISPTLDTRCDCLGVVNNTRIRKLTPKECFRLMGVKDEDFEKIAKNQSDSSLYHLAGDSIVVNVLMAIFKEMI